MWPANMPIKFLLPKACRNIPSAKIIKRQPAKAICYRHDAPASYPPSLRLLRLLFVFAQNENLG